MVEQKKGEGGPVGSLYERYFRQKENIPATSSVIGFRQACHSLPLWVCKLVAMICKTTSDDLCLQTIAKSLQKQAR